MHRNAVSIIQSQHCAIAELDGLIDQCLALIPVYRRQAAHDNLDVVFAEPIQPKPFSRRMNFAVCSNLCVTMALSPLGHVGVKALSILHHRGEQAQFSTLPRFGL
jgi:hypothetical protein